MLNPPTPYKPCCFCGILTNETYSIHGVSHYLCYKNTRSNIDSTFSIHGNTVEYQAGQSKESERKM